MRDVILRIIAERLDIPRESLDVSARIEALGFSSLELIHAISDVQDHYGVYIPSAEFSHMMVPTVRLGDILEELIRFIHSSTAASDIPTPKPGHG